jgi:hypothetical protein
MYTGWDERTGSRTGSRRALEALDGICIPFAFYEPSLEGVCKILQIIAKYLIKFVVFA